MPKSLDEFDNLEEDSNRQGGRKVNWDKVAEEIIARNGYFTAGEVHADPKMVGEKVTLFRTKRALDELSKKTKKRPKLLSRVYDENKYWYGPIIKNKGGMKE